jgi:hypothetical protein
VRLLALSLLPADSGWEVTKTTTRLQEVLLPPLLLVGTVIKLLPEMLRLQHRMIQMHVACLVLLLSASVVPSPSLYAPASFHHSADIEYFSQISGRSHEVGSVNRLVCTVEDFLGEVVSTAEANGGRRSGKQEGVMQRLLVSSDGMISLFS